MILLEYNKMAVKSTNYKKKILYVITKSVWAGAGKYVYDLATNLPKDRFEVFVAAGGKDELARKLIRAGIPYFEIKSFQRDINIIKEILAYFEILLLLLKIRPDVIHVNSSKAGGIVGVAAWDYRFLTFLNFSARGGSPPALTSQGDVGRGAFGGKLKIIFTAHGWAFHESRPRWQTLLIKLFTKITCFYYSKIICVSEYDYQSAISNRIASKRKLLTIHNGINYDEYKFLPKEEARKVIRKGPTFAKRTRSDLMQEFWIGTIGEFTKNKGQKYLIDAIKLLVTRYPLLAAIIIGWGEEKSNLSLLVTRYSLQNNVLLIDNLPNASPYLTAFDIFVLPSVKEGLPYTLLEAGLAGLPVISTNVGGIPEIIGHDEGFLVEPADSDALAEKIEEFINNPEKGKTMAANLRQKILKEFSLSKMLRATTAAYE